MPPAQLGVKPPEIEMTDESDNYDESPIYPGRGPGVSPPYPVRGWELMESPMMEQKNLRNTTHMSSHMCRKWYHQSFKIQIG